MIYAKKGTVNLKTRNVVEFQPDGSLTLNGTFEVPGGSGKYTEDTAAARSTARFHPGAA